MSMNLSDLTFVIIYFIKSAVFVGFLYLSGLCVTRNFVESCFLYNISIIISLLVFWRIKAL